MLLKLLLLNIARMMGLFALSRFLTRGQLRILCYHGIWLGPQPHYGDCLFMSAGRFKDRMAMLARSGYRIIPLSQACAALEQGHARARDVVITIDDGWAGTFVHMLPTLKEHAFPATLYATTENMVKQEPVIYVMAAYFANRAKRIPDLPRLFPGQDLERLQARQLSESLAEQILAQPTAAARKAETYRLAELLGIDYSALEVSRAFLLMTPNEVAQAHRMGLDIELHTHSHRMHDFGAEQLRGELQLNRELLAEMLDVRPDCFNHFCYPSGLYKTELFPTLETDGIRSATTTEPGINGPGTSPFALKRILDCESLSDIEIEARLSGFWNLASSFRDHLQRLFARAKSTAAGPAA